MCVRGGMYVRGGLFGRSLLGSNPYSTCLLREVIIGPQIKGPVKRHFLNVSCGWGVYGEVEVKKTSCLKRKDSTVPSDNVQHPSTTPSGRCIEKGLPMIVPYTVVWLTSCSLRKILVYRINFEPKQHQKQHQHLQIQGVRGTGGVNL